MRRCPEENNAEQYERCPAERAGDGSPADEHGHAARGAAPHDVLRRSALEQQRVDEDVEQNRAERKPSGEPIGEKAEPEY